MKDRIIPLLMVFGISMFCGFVVIAPGLGSLTSPLNRLAAPAVCGERPLEIEKRSDVYIQGDETHQVTAYCMDAATGERQDVSAQLIAEIGKWRLITGFVSGLVLFALGMWFLNWAARRRGTSIEELFQPGVRRT